jgi:5-methyltetrahydrofolate--homocysteine methyltransferase
MVIPELDIARLRPFIDWTPFFITWQLKGKYPRIFEHPKYGAEARRLFDDAQRLLDRMEAEQVVQARGVAGLWPAARRGDDLVIYSDESRQQERMVVHHLRRQRAEAKTGVCPCLADFVAPEDSGVADWVGGFAVSGGFGADEFAAVFERQDDDYHAILVKALADRLAEAFAERLHWQVRHDLWGYEPDPEPDNEQLIAERYRGIRPAPGYPACPDHTEKPALFELLEAPARLGVTLTESCMMVPAASVSGWYFSHPEARYFGIGRIGEDQVADYARRKGWDLATAERWLAPILGYEPSAETT